MKKIIFLIISFCWLFVKPISSQTNWTAYKDIALPLVKYGIYSDGKEVNVFTPSSANNNYNEFIQLKSDGTLVWGNNGNGTEYFKYSIKGEFCYFNRSSTEQSWLRIVKKTDDMLFTVDNSNIYRYFQTVTGKDLFSDEELEEINNYNPYNHMNIESTFYEGLARFSLYGFDGFIDKQGQVVIPAKYVIASDFHDGLVRVWDSHENKWMFLDRTGNKVIETSSSADDFHEGLACVSNEKSKWGYIDKQGKMVIPYRYDLSEVMPNPFLGFGEKHEWGISYFSEGLAAVRRNNWWGFIDRQGQEVVPLEYDFVRPFSEGLAGVMNDEKWGFINKQGKIVIPLEYDDVDFFSEGYAPVEKDGKRGFINKQGKIVIPLEYDDAIAFSEGLAGVKKDRKWGFINKQGKIVIPLEYDYADFFSEGYAPVEKNNARGYIDKTGRVVIPLQHFQNSIVRHMASKKNLPNKDIRGKFHDGYGLVWKNGDRFLNLLMSNNGEILDVKNIKIDAMSLYNVGQIKEDVYYNGLGKDDLQCALANYLKSANLGNPYACYKLGYFYYSGIGFMKNYAEAAKWYEKSLPINNDGENYRYLAYCYIDGGYGLEKNASKAFNLFIEGAKTGNEYCEFALAVCYRLGLGCQVNIEEACKYADRVYAKNKSEYASVYSVCYNQLTYFYLNRKDNNNALISIEKAINAKPNDPDLYDSKGEVLLNMGRVNEAVKMWHKVLELNPRFLDDFPEGTELYKQLKAKGLI